MSFFRYNPQNLLTFRAPLGDPLPPKQVSRSVRLGQMDPRLSSFVFVPLGVNAWRAKETRGQRVILMTRTMLLHGFFHCVGVHVGVISLVFKSYLFGTDRTFGLKGAPAKDRRGFGCAFIFFVCPFWCRSMEGEGT